MRRALAATLFAVAAVPAASEANAQSFDCAKAKSTVEKAICASPDLMAQDKALAAAFAAALARDPAKADDLRKAQRAWALGRSKTCAPDGAAQAKVIACLTGLYRTRLAALNPAPGPQPAQRQPLPATATAPATTPTDTSPAAAVPILGAAVLPAPTVLMPGVPTLPAPAPAAAATLSAGTAPAAGRSDVLLTVGSPGRFAVSAESKTGVALQLVDMVAGPGDTVGEPGVRDGRLDVLLDRGTSKLRLTGAPNAAGEAALKVAAFVDAEPPATSLFYGGETSATLLDLQQRSVWVAVPQDGRLAFEAIGRNLADVRVWRNGTDLQELKAQFAVVEPRAGKPMLRARFDGKVEPGAYLVTAYGGPGQRWTDGDATAPFHLRVGPPETLVSGWVEGVIGPMGSIRFSVPVEASVARLELPEPAAARLGVVKGGSGSAAIARNSREPVASVAINATAQNPVTLEVSGTEGQPFRLRTLRNESAARYGNGNGPHWVALDVAGEGGDDLPAAVVLARFENNRNGTVLASTAPKVGPGQAWRRSFNLRGTTTLPIEVTAVAPLVVTTDGPGVKATLEPLVGGAPPRADGQVPNQWSLDPGWYWLRIEPVNNAVGVLDVTVGPPGQRPDRLAPSPPRASIALGIHPLEPKFSYVVFTSRAPGMVTQPVVRRLPILLANAPLTVVQEPGQVLEMPVTYPVKGAIGVAEVTGVPVPVALADLATEGDQRKATVRIPAPERRRTVVIAWSDPQSRVPSAPTLAAIGSTEALAAGAPRFLDIEKDATRSFGLTVPEGGLYRIETLGRLKTELAVSTAFLPGVSKAEANGAGENALLQTYLRAGRYRLSVTARESEGRLGVIVARAALDQSAPLLPDGSIRASLTGGRGLAIPLSIATAGQYRLSLDGLDRTFTARLEDAEGWPLTVPGELDTLAYRFEPGRYRVVVMPEAVDARLVARLETITPPVERTGHGPHGLVFDATQRHQWREPQGAADERTPDRWTFALAGPAAVTLSIGDGMVGDLVRTDGGRRTIARIVHKADYKGTLEAGDYVVEARGLGRNDRLDYEIGLEAEELQPGVPRDVSLPATIPFAVAADRVVNLTTTGRIDVKAILRDADGRIVERLDDRTDDWNIALSRMLKAGRYTLELSEVTEAASVPVNADQPSGDDDGGGGGDGEAGGEAGDGDDGPAVTVHLALPEPADRGALALTGSATASGGGVHRFALPALAADALLVATAQSTAELVLAIEVPGENGRWATLGQARGLRPVLAVPTRAEASAWRLAAWSVDGEAAPITIAARIARQAPAEPGRIAWERLGLEGVGADMAVARVKAPQGGILGLTGDTASVIQGSRTGRPLGRVEGHVLVPQDDSVWLAASGQGPVNLTAEPLVSAAEAMSLTIPEDGSAILPAIALRSGIVRLWRVDAPFGRAGIDGGKGTGLGRGSALALDGGRPVRVWNAGDAEALPVTVTPIGLALGEAAQGSTEMVLPPKTARPVKLPPGLAKLNLDLPIGTTAVAGWTGGSPVTVWGGTEAVSRTLEGTFDDVLLANVSDRPLPVRLDVTPAGGLGQLTAGTVLKRFFGAAGSLSLPVAADAGDRLVVAGATAEWLGADGRLQSGTSFRTAGPGRLTVSHNGGLVALWIERASRPAWPQVAAQTVAAPARLAMAGETMTLAVPVEGPSLVTVRTTAPVILGLKGEAAAPTLFPSGAEFHRFVAGGIAEIAAYSPQDGPLSGSIEVTTRPVTPVGEGLGDAVALAPGGSALFRFTLGRAGPVGIGVRSEPDRAEVRLLDAQGRALGEGVAQLHTLQPGAYLVESRIPVDGATTRVRPAVLGVAPPPAGPPSDIAQHYLELVGLKPTKAQ